MWKVSRHPLSTTKTPSPMDQTWALNCAISTHPDKDGKRKSAQQQQVESKPSASQARIDVIMAASTPSTTKAMLPSQPGPSLLAPLNCTRGHIAMAHDTGNGLGNRRLDRSPAGGSKNTLGPHCYVSIRQMLWAGGFPFRIPHPSKNKPFLPTLTFGARGLCLCFPLRGNSLQAKATC